MATQTHTMISRTLSHPDNETRASGGRNVRRIHCRADIIGGIFVVACAVALFVAGLTVYRQTTDIDPVHPDYSELDENSATYWTDRIQIDIATAQQSADSEDLRHRRLRTFANQTVTDALTISSPYFRAQAVTGIAIVLAQHDINITFNSHLQRLGSTSLVASMRARAMISQVLMHLRLGNVSAAQSTMQQYSQLAIETDLKLNSPLNEESFFGAVTALHLLNDQDGLYELFNRHLTSSAVVGFDQQMRAYRLIVGEQIRVGMASEALETAQRIRNHVELARALALFLQYSARPPTIISAEPSMLELLEYPLAEPPLIPEAADQAANAIFHYLAENQEINAQAALLQRIVSSRLALDTPLLEIFRQSLLDSAVLDEMVKQRLLRYLDVSESSVHQSAPTADDWTMAGEIIHVEIMNIDPTPLRTRSDQRWIQVLLAIAQGHQSIRRFHDADRVLQQAFIAAQRFVEPNIRFQLLQRIGEQQITIGSIADAKETFAVIAAGADQQQKRELARLQIIARLFDDALATLSSIELPEDRESACSFLLREQIRLNDIQGAERTFSLMPQGDAKTEAHSRLNIAREQASREDFNAFRISVPEGESQDWERYCIGLIQQGVLRLADQSARYINDVQKRTDIQTRVAREYLSLYQTFNDANDPSRLIRQGLLQSFVLLAERMEQPVVQAAILTELLMYLAEQLQTEEDRATAKRLWSLAMTACREIAESGKKATLFARLIVVKNMLDNPNLAKKTLPLFTRATEPSLYEENNRLIEECLDLINLLGSEEEQVYACVYLARALTQIDRIQSAQALLDHALGIAINVSNQEETVSMLLSLVPVLRDLNSADEITNIYRLAIDKVIFEFTNRISNVDEFEWRKRDSDIERIVRSQMENGFLDDAVESANRLNEPMLRDRLLRSAVYFYLDFENIERAELVAQRMAAREIKNNVLQNIQTFKRRHQPQTP